MFGRMIRALRLIMSAPSGPITAANLKETLRKRYGFDQDTRNLLDGLGINQDRLAEPDFDLQTYLMGRNLKMALEKAIETEEGRELLSEASKYEPGSPELRHLHGVLLEHFGDPRVGRFLQYLEGLPSR
jgi:hypothetical protein